MAADWVIVVDDDRNDQKMACEMLHRAGIRTTAMRSGSAALDYIRKGGIPDLILLDADMPETDGFETLRLLREEMDPENEIPVVLMTGEDDQEAQGLEEGAADGKRPLCIAVTILTSITKEMMNEELGIPGEVQDTVIRYALNAKEAGLDGVVCSVHEARAIHAACGDEFLTVTPGIRLADDKANDQKRVATPAYAKEQGCDMIVVGRSITKSADPVKTYREIEGAMN